MPNTDLPVAQEPSRFEIAVRDRSWDWLLELRRRLKVDLLLVGGRPSVLLPPHGEQPARLAGMLEQGEAALLSAIDTAQRLRTPQALALEGLQIVCVAVVSERLGSGALVVGRAFPAKQDSASSRAQLELVASWLSSAVEAHLISPPAFPSSGLNRVAPLAKLLSQASERDSDRELIRLFGEAVAVWHDIEVCGYVETPEGTFTRDVTLPGTRKGERPVVIPSIGLPDSAELTRLPQGHLDRFGLPVDSDVYVRRFKHGDGPSWLLVFTGVIDGYDLQRLGAYVALLESALNSSTMAAANSVAMAVSARLAGGESGAEARAARALEDLRRAVGAASATLTIESRGGSPTLRVRSPNAPADDTVERGGVRLVLVKGSERHYTTTVSLSRDERLPFTPRDHAAAGAAAAMFELWSPAAFASAPDHRERRSASNGFLEVLERSARESLEQGLPVAAVVLLIPEAVNLPGSTQRWVAGIRAQLRASDVAGMLAEGEIGLLMQDTAAGQATSIAERLRGVVGGAPGRESIHIGVASRTPDQGNADGIVREARADAASGVRRARASGSPQGVNR
jgi:hypothetical protein